MTKQNHQAPSSSPIDLILTSAKQKNQNPGAALSAQEGKSKSALDKTLKNRLDTPEFIVADMFSTEE